LTATRFNVNSVGAYFLGPPNINGVATVDNLEQLSFSPDSSGPLGANSNLIWGKGVVENSMEGSRMIVSVM